MTTARSDRPFPMSTPVTRSIVAWLLAALAAGCGGTEKSQAPAPGRTGASRQTSAPEAPPPGTIVIRGRKSADRPGTEPVQDELDREAIAELEEQARASQGQPVPHPPRPDARPRGQPDPTREGRARQAIEGEIAAVTKQITDLQAEKDELMVDKRVRRGSRRVLREVSSDPERTAAIDAEISQLEGKRQELQQRLATLQR